MDKRDVLRKYLDELGPGPEQRTLEWLRRRMKTIGGSEVATVAGLNPWQKIPELVAQKIGLSSFRGNILCHWGICFETQLQLYLEKTFQTKIFETGSIAGPTNQSYSPDGLCVIDKSLIIENLRKNGVKIDEGKMMRWVKDYGGERDAEQIIVLWELKNPFRRNPTHEIPKYYMPQIKSGLALIKVMELGIFCQAVYRRCSLTQLFNKGYDDELNCDAAPFSESEVIEKGVIFIYSKSPDIISVNSMSALADFGRRAERLAEVLEDIAEKRLFCHYFQGSPTLTPADVIANFDAFNKQCRANGYTPYGCLPFKLFKVYLTPVYKNPTYNQKFAKEINDVMKIVTDCLDTETFDEMLAKYSKHFPKKKRVKKNDQKDMTMLMNL
nr:hypothetical protein K-LCC10_0411 [Kaumoebavirus]